MGNMSKKPASPLRLGFYLVLIFAVAALAGCATNNKTGTQPTTAATQQPAAAPQATKPAVKPSAEPAEPVTIYIKHASGNYDNKSADWWAQNFADPIHKKYPNITVKLTKGHLTDQSMATGEPMDIIMGSTSYVPIIQSYDLQTNLEPFIKKYGFDLSRFEPAAIAESKQFSGGELDFLPFSNATQAPIYYNKDIFDMFGVPYPKDGMTWDQIYDLAKQLTRKQDGQQYYGFILSSNHYFVRNQLALNMVDPKTFKVTIETDQAKTLVENLARFYQLPGYNTMKNPYAAASQRVIFSKDKSAAMYATPGDTRLLPEELQGMNWDLVSYPEWPDKPGIGPMLYPMMMTISKTSKHPDAAFEVLQYLLSDEYQTSQMESATINTLLLNPKVRQSFGTQVSLYNGKNVAAFVYGKPAPASPQSKYYLKGAVALWTAMQDYVAGKTDLNTALREQAEKLTQYIAQQQKK